MKFKILGILASIFFMTNTASATCTLQPISLESNITAAWSSDCNATHRGDEFDVHYAKYYTFTLTEPTIVKIDLTSQIDSYLYLLEGADTYGMLLEADDDGGEGLNSKIIIELSEGNYTIETTTFSAEQTGTFNISLKETTFESYSMHGTIELPQEILTSLEDCNDTEGTCPTIYGYAYGYTTYDFYSYDFYVDYNDTSGNYEYSFDMLLEAEETTIDLSFSVYFNWVDEEGNYQYRRVYYSFGEDQAIGGTAENMDTAINSNCNISIYPLTLELNTTLPTIPLDFSEYIFPVYTTATMTINNIPDDLSYMSLYAYSQNECNAQLYAGYSNNDDGSRTYTFTTLEDGVEYGLVLYTETYEYEEVCYYDENGTEYCDDYPITNYYNYRLNDDDGDFTNGGVFVEDAVYDENYNYVFDRTLLAMPEDMVLSEPNNLFEPKTAPVAPILYLLM